MGICVSNQTKTVNGPGFGAHLAHPIKWLAVFSVATNLLMLAVPIHMMQVYDRVLSSRSSETLLYLTLVVVAALAVFGTAEALRSMLSQRLSARFAKSCARDLFDEIVSTRQPEVDRQGILRDFTQLRTFLAGRQMIGLFDLPFAPLFLVLMFALHYSLGALSLLGVLALVGIAYANKKSTAALQEAASESNGSAQGFAQAVLLRAEDIRAMGLLPNIMNWWGSKTVESLNAADAAAERSAMFYGLSRFVRQSLQVLMMAWGAFLVILGDMSGGLIFAASMISSRALMPIEQVIGGWSNIAEARAAYERITDFLARRQDIRPATALPNPKGIISVENLVYETGCAQLCNRILNGISFSVYPGTILAVVGPSGAGKSTLARLLVGAIAPSSGAIRLDGFELEQWGDAVRGGAIGYVPQDISLFPGTLAENISRLDANPDDRRIVNAAIKAGVHELIARFPEGYQTTIGASRMVLSGGQRQRIALARAFYSDPRVLVLDEPNAHLDQDGEQKLMSALGAARAQGITVIVVTQRRSMLRIADQVMLLKDGRVASLMPRDEFLNAVSESAGKAEPAATAATKAQTPPPPPASASQAAAFAPPGPLDPMAPYRPMAHQLGARANPAMASQPAAPQQAIHPQQAMPPRHPLSSPQQAPRPQAPNRQGYNV